jgi:hypothetical protein
MPIRPNDLLTAVALGQNFDGIERAATGALLNLNGGQWTV